MVRGESQELTIYQKHCSILATVEMEHAEHLLADWTHRLKENVKRARQMLADSHLAICSPDSSPQRGREAMGEGGRGRTPRYQQKP